MSSKKTLAFSEASRRQSCLAGDDEGIKRLLTVCLFQRSTRRQNLTSSKFMIEGIEHLQNMGLACVKNRTDVIFLRKSHDRPFSLFPFNSLPQVTVNFHGFMSQELY